MVRKEEYDDGYRPEDFDDPNTELIIDPKYFREPPEDAVAVFFCEECGITSTAMGPGDEHCNTPLILLAHVTLETEEERAPFNYDNEETA